ncbi:MAG: 5-(carboxyamino)imidazole ribonucleotide synthase [Gammaproteobacteria bacterium]|nr:MAG: 5-(carboxyamino)imidazole ribonucleotide synthase [Gammaproteobacteria bacterium]
MKIGILGAGQLGRMMVLEGMPLGLDFVLYDPAGKPSANVGEILVPDNGSDVLQEFLSKVDVVTYEFEHLPLDQVRIIAEQKPVYPGVEALRVCQHRALEKALFDELKIPTAPYRIADSEEALAQAVRELGTPVVAKSVTEGYDGKGQAVIRSPEEAGSAWARIGHEQVLVEKFVQFEREVSIVAVRSRDGEVRTWPMGENLHQDGILRLTRAPAPGLSEATQKAADDYITRILNRLDYVGVLALELFETSEGLLANEMAPRVHNSGHWTQNGAAISQFENHIRAVAGLPLGATHATAHTCMINLIGELPDISGVLSHPDAHLHLYGKSPRAGRKLGHINVVNDDADALENATEALLRQLSADHSLRQ